MGLKANKSPWLGQVCCFKIGLFYFVVDVGKICVLSVVGGFGLVKQTDDLKDEQAS